MPGITQLAGEIFDRPARVGYPLKCGGLVGEYKSPVYSTAVGLVLYADDISGSSERNVTLTRESGLHGRFKSWLKEFF